MMNLKELIRILRNSGTTNEIDKRRDDITDLIPAVSIMLGYDQQNLAHQYDLWEHSLRTVVGLPKDIDDDMVCLCGSDRIKLIEGECMGDFDIHIMCNDCNRHISRTMYDADEEHDFITVVYNEIVKL